MTNVRRPVHLQLRPTSIALAAKTTTTTTTPSACSPKALSPTGDSLPSQIMPNLFVGNLDQTNRETVNRLNISYILSLGLLPLISSASPASPSPTSTAATMIMQMPNQNTSKDFKIRLRTSSAAAANNILDSKDSPCSGPNSSKRATNSTDSAQNVRDENKGVRLVRSVSCKCINIADNSEQILSKFFDEAHQFIDEARRKKCNILVHCLAGISRSPTIAIAYLMRVQSLRLQEAYNLVKQCRPQIDPNLSFMGQLMIYEKSLEEQRLAVKKGGHHHQVDYNKE